jgi:hypothetical protein
LPRNASFSLSAFDPEGKLRWSIPTSVAYREKSKISGEGIMGPVDAGGETGEILGVTQWHGLHVPLVTTDGLLIAKLLRDPADGGEAGPDMYKGETIQRLNKLDDGRVIEPSVLVGERRRGRRIVVTGDTRPCENTIAAAQDADLLIHEATFADDEAARALETGHSTAREAAEVARKDQLKA